MDLPARRCAWCKRLYTPTDEAQLFCTPRHSKNARARRREREDSGPICPRPDKRAYPTAEAATSALASINRHDLEAYPCICGFWHVGSIPEWMANKEAAP